MKRNFDAHIQNIDGSDAMEAVIGADGHPRIENGRPVFAPVPLRIAIANALTGNYDGEQGLSFEVKQKRYRLAKKVIAGGDIDLSSEEVSMISALATRGLTTLVFGQVVDALESDGKRKASE